MKSLISEIKGVKERTGPNGTVWFFSMTMENGDKVNIGKKSQDALKLGQSIDYEVVSTDEYGVKKIKEIKENPFQGGGKSYSKNYEADMISFAMSYAKDLVIADKATISELPIMAEKIYSRMVGQYKLLSPNK